MSFGRVPSSESSLNLELTGFTQLISLQQEAKKVTV